MYRHCPEDLARMQPSGVYVAIGVLKSISLYVFLAMLVCMWRLGVSAVNDAAADPKDSADYFLASGYVALAVLVATVVLSVVITFLGNRFRRDRIRSSSYTNAILGGLAYAFINPFNGVRALATNKRVNDLSGFAGAMTTTYSIFHFCWAVALIFYLAAGFVAVALQ
jgi:hypothetical protein